MAQQMKKKQPRDFRIIFESLEDAKKSTKEPLDVANADYEQIDEGIKAIQELQQSVDTESFVMFTRS